MNTIFDPVEGRTDLGGRALMALCAVAAGFAAASAFAALGAQLPDRIWIELWRALGFGVFALLFILLALRPRRSAGIWEVVFLDKALLGLFSIGLAAAAEAPAAGPVDGGLAAVTLVAYVLTRGWQGWRR